MEVEDGSANMEVEDDDARLRAEVLAYMKANRVTRVSLGASTEVDLREGRIGQDFSSSGGHSSDAASKGVTFVQIAACP